ncbi:hypothetical protein GCK72_002668 [Caenorhabditis remanei]|uniref:Uncharacterized protein n=1 Tax=Caenorhabditis remanei TaxID=31234 RepID=A0A6A5HVT2_CAERE|nr:hypothetical protein GCK72_002668 [Caenorhabditis remanei]KAF1770844.1 hypothetical protein GCK72_002668 [Caenorhabditis remanei]
MCDADLCQKIWGLRAVVFHSNSAFDLFNKFQTHFFIAAGCRAALAFLYLLAIFDYVGLPEEEAEKIRETFWNKFMNNFLIHFIYSAFILAWLLCPSRCWYGFLSVLQLFYAVFAVFETSIELKDYIAAQHGGENYEHFKIGMFGYFAHNYLSVVVAFYVGFILVRLSCLSPPKQPDLYVVHVIHDKTKDSSSSSSSEKKSEDSESQKSP